MIDARNKTEVIQLRVTAEQKRIIQRAATKTGATVTAWLTQLALAQARAVGADGPVSSRRGGGGGGAAPR